MYYNTLQDILKINSVLRIFFYPGQAIPSNVSAGIGRSLFFVVQHTMAIAFKIRIFYFFPEIQTHTFGIFTDFQHAGTMSIFLLQAFTDHFDQFLIFIQSDFHNGVLNPYNNMILTRMDIAVQAEYPAFFFSFFCKGLYRHLSHIHQIIGLLTPGPQQNRIFRSQLPADCSGSPRNPTDTVGPGRCQQSRFLRTPA